MRDGDGSQDDQLDGSQGDAPGEKGEKADAKELFQATLSSFRLDYRKIQ